MGVPDYGYPLPGLVDDTPMSSSQRVKLKEAVSRRAASLRDQRELQQYAMKILNRTTGPFARREEKDTKSEDNPKP